MRLLHVDTLNFSEFPDDTARPEYVIASHRWGPDEATFASFRDGTSKADAGYQKVIAFVEHVKDRYPSIKWVWIDTCCINREDEVELSHAINAMFKWYRDARVCVAYLATVTQADDWQNFKSDVWFQRGWTLQELLAPRLVVFVTRKWQVIGSKGSSGDQWEGMNTGPDLGEEIAEITAIPVHVLNDWARNVTMPNEVKMDWMKGRKTMLEEDMIYAMFGLFGVALGVDYGEGGENARSRLLTALRQEEEAFLHLQACEAPLPRSVDQHASIAWRLSPPDPWTNHHLARKLHEPNTGTWLLKSTQYRSWTRGVHQCLWVHGPPGCGKTVLCSVAVQDMQQYAVHKPRTGHAIFYFSFFEERKQTYDNLLASLVAQLAVKGPSLSMLETAVNKPLLRGMLDRDDLQSVLHLALKSYDEVIVHLDALDECPLKNGYREDLLQAIGKLLRRAPHVRMIVTSRDEPDIRRAMEQVGAESIRADNDLVTTDIRKYVSTQLSRDERLSRLDLTTRSLVEETLSRKANGIFRWASYQLQELAKSKSTRPRSIRLALTRLPMNLDETYERILGNIHEQDRSYAMTVLQWVAYARFPPTLLQISEAGTVDPTHGPNQGGTVDSDERGGWDDALVILAGLVVPIEEDPLGTDDNSNVDEISSGYGDVDDYFTGSFAYLSTDEQSSYSYPSADDHCSDKKPVVHDRSSFFPFEDDHSSEFYPSMSDRSSDFYPSVDDPTSNDQVMNGDLLEPSADVGIDDDALKPPEPSSRLRLAHFSLKEYLESTRIRETSARAFHLDPARSHGFLSQSCLVYLSHHGAASRDLSESELLEKFPLLDYCARHWHEHARLQVPGDVSRQIAFLTDDDCRRNWVSVAKKTFSLESGELEPASPIYFASLLNLDEVVAGLIALHHDVNGDGGVNGRALAVAIDNDNPSIVRMLLDAGANIELDDACSMDRTHLEEACLRGREAIVRLLIDAGAAVNGVESCFSAPLQMACVSDHAEVVRMLLDAGADVNACKGLGGSALQMASRWGGEKAVTVLLNAGADVNLRGGDNGGPLYLASEYGHDAVVRTLLESGADVHVVDGKNYSCALQAASAGGYDKIVRMLIDAGVDVNADTEGYYGNALQAAAGWGRKKVVRLLLEAGVNVNTASARGEGNALQIASASGKAEMVQLLLAAGADINAPGRGDLYPLWGALINDMKDVVPVLEAAGGASNLTKRDPLGRSLVVLAASQGSLPAINYAVTHGMSVRDRDRQRWTALHWAAYFGHDDAARLLVKLGCEVNAADRRGWTPLKVASFVGNEETARYLSIIVRDGQVHDLEDNERFWYDRCRVCKHEVIDKLHHCTVCEHYDLCFRCILDVNVLHPGHTFTTDFRYDP